VSAASSPPSAASATSPGGTASAPPAITVRARVMPPYGEVLTDAHGRALYVLEADGDCASRCAGMCAVIWPPLAAVGGAAPRTGDARLRAELLGVRAPASGGPPQATYRGRLLYYYLGDRDSTTALGHHVEDSWGEWRLVAPSGALVAGGGVAPESGRGRRGRGRDDRLNR
jgi:predicted lipoprotein with Yx(FWY)xxD motif